MCVCEYICARQLPSSATTAFSCVCVLVAETQISIHLADAQCHNQYTIKAHWVPFNNTEISTMVCEQI